MRFSKGTLPQSIGGEPATVLPVDYNNIYPELHGYLIKPLLVSPPMCQLHQLKDGTYSLVDLEKMHQIIEIRQHMKPVAAPPSPNGIGGLS